MRTILLLERIVDFSFIFLLAAGLSFLIPLVYAFIAALMIYLILPILIKKTPAMALFKRQFKRRPSLLKVVKSLFWSCEREISQRKCGRFRKIAGVCLALLCIAGSYFECAEREFSISFEAFRMNAEWSHYTSDKGFAVQLPDEPTFEAKQLYIPEADKTLNYKEFKSFEGSNVYYTVSYMDFPSRWRFVSSSKLLNTAFDVLLKEDPDVELIFKNSVNHKSFPAIEFSMKKGNEEMSGRLVLVGNTFYKVMRVAPASLAAKEDSQFEEFIQSFEVLSK
jgi:hypothetical protein